MSRLLWLLAGLAAGAGAAVFFVPTPSTESASPTTRFTHHYVESDPDRPFSPTFLGVPAWQNPCDMWVMQEIVAEVAPDLIIETGTAHGGSALYYATILDRINPNGRVITIDVEPKVEKARTHALFREKVEVIVSDSVAPELIARLTERARGKTVLVTLDSLHGRTHVAKELELYAPLVSTGSYLVVQDTIIDSRPEWVERYTDDDAGPAEAVRAFLAANPGWQPDHERTAKFLFTFHPGGYLRRLR